ncbi:MAG: hypothetical protein ACPGRZ_15065 [Alphaproteobacteria bacterium]
MTAPLYVFFGAESEYVLHPLYVEMTTRGHHCVELHAMPGSGITGDLAATAADKRPKVLITSAHFDWDARYMMSQMEVPDCPALVEIISILGPAFTVYYPHDLSQPVLTSESAKLGLIDLYLAPSYLEHMFTPYTNVRTVGWIKAPKDLHATQERWGRGLWLTMSLEYILVEHGTRKTLGIINDWLTDWLWIKFPPYPQFDEIETILKDRGINILDRNMTPPVAARHFDFVVTNGESSVVRESALMGVPTYLVTDIGLFGEESQRNLWQFVDLPNVHVVANLESIPDDIPRTEPQMLAFDMDAAIDAIVSGASARTGAE